MTDITLPEKYDVITAAALASASADPVSVARDIMRDGRISMHGPEHHYLDGAAFIAAYRNAGGEIDAAACLKALAARVVSMPGAMCGLWGVCLRCGSVGGRGNVRHTRYGAAERRCRLRRQYGVYVVRAGGNEQDRRAEML